MDLYAKLDVNYRDDPAVIEAGPEAELVYVRALALAKRIPTNGHIHRAHLFGLTSDLPSVLTGELDAAYFAKQLVHTELWVECDDGWIIRTWLEHNDSREEIEARREEKTEAGAKGNHKRWHKGKQVEGCRWCESQPVAPAIAPAKRVGSPSRVEQSKAITLSVSSAEPFDADFEAWWVEYPRKIAKAEARKAYRARRRQGITTERLLAAAGNYKQAKFGSDPQFVKHGASFLAKDGSWSEWEHGCPETTVAAVATKPPPWRADEVRRCKICANTGNYVKDGVVTPCKTHVYP